MAYASHAFGLRFTLTLGAALHDICTAIFLSAFRIYAKPNVVLNASIREFSNRSRP